MAGVGPREIVAVSVFTFSVVILAAVGVYFATAVPDEDNPPPDLEEDWFMNRSSWFAKDPTFELVPLNASQFHVVIAHTVTDACFTKQDCITLVQMIQNIHMTDYGDVAYNFMVGGDGRVYEGVGWDFRGSHTANCNTNCTGIAFLGNYVSHCNHDKITATQVKYAQLLLEYGLINGKLTEDYDVLAHCQVAGFSNDPILESPGDNIFKELRTWDRFNSDPEDFTSSCLWDEYGNYIKPSPSCPIPPSTANFVRYSSPVIILCFMATTLSLQHLFQ